MGIRSYILKRLVPKGIRHKYLKRRVWLLREIYENPKTPYSIAEFYRLKCIFFHIPKTAGLSVSFALFGSRGAAHLDTELAELVFGVNAFAQFYKFAFVRNPWDRTVSAYEYLRQGGLYHSVSPWLQKCVLPYDTFESFLRESLCRPDTINNQHFRPQSRFICDNKLRIKVDFVGKFETLEKDFQLITNRLNIHATLPALNMSTRRDYRTFYNEETKQIVADLYQDDIRLFNYTFDAA